ncbi:hypothetical protein A3L11_04080 [Thermococcus siculi]|uniref:Uncharacterized protein n=1 Tax=Thermococcus siculi TaxID=72803 RepID=A0A2Z2MWA0_9EURY|nr:hypothetical protein [Thermococcus siculi]ASJ08453.1 hypothetical protein A3L11_04080 [Thermococcus siculi]
MRVKDAWPLTAPSWMELFRVGMMGIWIALMLVGWEKSSLGPGYLLLPLLLLPLTAGSGVEVQNGELVLTYGGFIKVSAGSVKGVTDLSGVRFASIGRHVIWALSFPVFFTVLAFLLLGVEGGDVSGALLYWAFLYAVILLVPVKTLKEKAHLLMLSSLFLPWILIAPWAKGYNGWGMSLFYSLTGFFYLMGFVGSDHVLVSTDRGEFVIWCYNARKVMHELVGSHEG